MEGWHVSTLGKLCQIELGRTPSRSNPNFWDTNKVTDNVWLSIADLPQTFNARVFESKEHISDEALAKSKLVLEGTLLVSFKLTLGRLAFAGRNLYTNEAIASLTILDEKEITKEYLYWYLTYFDWDKAAEGEEKIKGKTLNKKKLNVLPVIIPPLSEQKQIVATLDKAFAAIDTATANTKNNLANARELFESQLELAFAGKTDSEGWQELKIKDVVQPLTTVNPRKNPSLPFKYIDVSSVSRSSYLIEEPATLLGSYAPSRARRRVQSGDVIFATIRPTLQRISIVPEHLDGSICSTGYYVLRSGKKIVNRFLFYYLFSRTFDEEMATLQRGTAYPAVSDRDIREHMISFPPLPEQRRIVKILDKLSAETRSLSDNYNTKLNALAELKQAFLHKSFCGEL